MAWRQAVPTRHPKALVIAGAQAQKASDFILGWAGEEQVEADAETADAAA